MGLDQYAFAWERSSKEEDGLLPYDYRIPKDAIQVASWRKHPNLEGWMSKLYAERIADEELAPEDMIFNCKVLELTKHDLLKLKNDVRLRKLPKTEGFFFGVDSDDHYEGYDLKFIKDALRVMNRGYVVVYTSWW